MSSEQGDPCHTLVAGGHAPAIAFPAAMSGTQCATSEDLSPALRQKAEAAGVPVATLLREALGRTDARRRKPAPRVDPALVLAVGRIGGNLNQIARWLNRAHAAGLTPTIDAVEIARRLLSVERQLAQLLAQGREC